MKWEPMDVRDWYLDPVYFTGQGGGSPAVKVGDAELLVYYECRCGKFRCGCVEGSHYPICPSCGEEVTPALTEDGFRLGYVARFMLEADAVGCIREGSDG